jgi:hypothetical protein
MMPSMSVWADVEAYDNIKRTPWRVGVLDRLYQVEEDVRRAISVAGWTLDETGNTPIITPGQDGHTDQTKEAQAVVTATHAYVRKAALSLSPCPRWRAPWDWLTGESLMSSYINLHSAETSRVLLLSAEQLVAALPSIRDRAVAYLPPKDARLTALEGVPDLTAPHQAALARMQPPSRRRLPELLHRVSATAPSGAAGKAQSQTPGITKLTGLLGRDQQIAAQAMGEACRAEDQQQAQVRHFREVLIGTFVCLLMVAVLLGLVGYFHPAYFPLCLPKQGGGTKAMICPSGGGNANGADLPLILGIGALGAALAVARNLTALKPIGVHYSLSVAQGLVKITLGALIAVLGIILMSTQVTATSLPGVLGTQAALLAAGLVFGYSQQLFTGAIDRQATSVQNAASPATPYANPNDRTQRTQ